MDKNTLLLSDGILSTTEISQAFAHYGANPGMIGDVIIECAKLIGLNSDFLACEIADESGWWTSDYANNRNNPSGFGAVDSNPDAAESFATVYDGVRRTVAHWGSYILGDTNPLLSEDNRAHFIQPQWYGTIKNVGSVGAGVWASAPDYADSILNRWREILDLFPSIPDNGGTAGGGDTGGAAPGNPPPPTNTTQGGSMTPDVSYSLPVRLDLANNAHSFPNRPTNSKGVILAIVKHVSAGESLDGALSWNRNPTVQASAHFYIDKDGTTVQDVSLFNGAWSNGILDNPSLPPQFSQMDAGGNPNDYTISIEHIGNPDDADFPTPAQLTADARLTADLCDYYKLPVDIDHIIGHYRFDSVNRPNCPGPHWNFDADVSAVNRLLNGDGSNATNVTQPSEHGTSTGSGGQSNGGIVEVAGDGYAVSEFSGQGDGRGCRVKYPGNDNGYRIGGGFFDEWYGSDTLSIGECDKSIRRDGLPLSDEFTHSTGNGPITVQLFENTVYGYTPERKVFRLAIGRDWRDAHRNEVPQGTYLG